ncbi:MAG TPA: DUF1116 domain-containing protein [Anaerolineales bacterium]|nr:DUF1116 domain-containing protein [Anaerolineales bacterium]
MENTLFENELKVVNLGLASFADSIADVGGSALQIDWQPPAFGDAEVGKHLALTMNNPLIDDANQLAFARYQAAAPRLVGVGTAGEDLPEMSERMILHAGPPIEWDRMCGPMKGAILGAILFEGWASNIEDAQVLAGSGEIAFEPCHHHNSVGPMAGVISPSMPVWIVHNPEVGNASFCNLNEGLGKALRFGANGPEVLERLHWMKDVLGPVLRDAVGELGYLDLKPIMAQALHMGDEVHNRNVAASALLLKVLAPALLDTGRPLQEINSVLRFIISNDHFFLNLSMAACKSMLDAAAGVPNSSMVVAMARNGVEFGVRLSGAAGAWFTTPAPLVDGLFFPGYTSEDAAPDLGDSSITETAGVGGFAMATSPAIVQFVGGTPSDAQEYTREMTHITLGRNAGFTLPALNFTGTPAGIDCRSVVDTGIAPIINTGIAHKEAGVGQIGAGITRAPLSCFNQAVTALAENLFENSGD